MIEGTTYVGASVCSKKDIFCYRIGRAIAVGRAIKNAASHGYDERSIKSAIAG
jgi:hypothetical protein